VGEIWTWGSGGGVAVRLRGIYEGVALSKSCCHRVCPDGIVCVARSVKGRGTGAVAIRTCTPYVHIWFQSP
jgi:NADPH-dependent glutamate synthase beta subunit-like oxidoreductase